MTKLTEIWNNMFEDSKDKEVVKDVGRGAALGGSLGAVAGGLKDLNKTNKKMAKWVQTGSKKAGYQVKSKLGKSLSHSAKSMLKSGAKGAAIGAGVIGAAHLGKKAYDHFKNKNESLTERLDQHIQNIRENVWRYNEIDGKKIKNDILRANPSHDIPDKEFKLLVLAILEPTLKANSVKFIKPNFNSFKNLLVKDIKHAIKAMTSETSWNNTMSKEEAIDMLFHDSEGEGDYVDTTFGEPYSILIDYVPELELYQKTIEKYLYDVIDQNEKSLISAVK